MRPEAASDRREGSGDAALEAFIRRWQGREGGQERANYVLFLSGLCAVLGVPQPEPAGAAGNDYVFERAVREPNGDGTHATRRIDLYRRGSFVLEAKQSRQPGGAKHLAGQLDLIPAAEPAVRGRRGAGRAWDVLMMNARRQAEGYAKALPADHGWPPFVLVCDVGHCLEVFADFTGQGKNYAQFPDRQGFRIYLEDLRRPEVRERLVRIWTDPHSLDPARRSAEVTRDIAARLAAVSRALEKDHPPEEVALFLMRCLFTMFAEDVGLLPERSFQNLLAMCESDPSLFQPWVGQLWEAMDRGIHAFGIKANVRRFNGDFFRSHAVLPLERQEIGELCRAAEHDWRDVEPAIFGTLLEQALNPAERRRLGAHYTPRAYVERLVVATVIEPLRADWAQALSTAERQKAEGRAADAVATVKAFHDALCATRVLDPACGTGNFLYVALELIKRLEGEVLEALADLGGQEALSGLQGHTVDPHQFLGLEINPRAAAIAELVLWIGYLQWHFRTRGAPPQEPILRAFKNIRGGTDAVLLAEKELARDAQGRPVTRSGADGPEPVYVYKNPRRPEWPAAEFIVGNPPFISGTDLRSRLGGEYAEALWAVHPWMNQSADLSMYWWDRAAELLTLKGTALRRFGMFTTKSITQMFQRRVLERHLTKRLPVSLTMAIPNHPWTRATKGAAAVRIAMTVAEAGALEGLRMEVVTQDSLDTDAPRISFRESRGRINPDLTVGVDVTAAAKLLANEGICHDGVKLHGKGFLVSASEAHFLGAGRQAGVEAIIRPYSNGRDVNQASRGLMVIDLFGHEEPEIRHRFPEVYQHLLKKVKPQRMNNNRKSYQEQWYLFGEPRKELRPALNKLDRYIVTVDTSTHRIFSFVDAMMVCDDKLVVIASDEAYDLGVLSSRIHVCWALAQNTRLGQGNDPVYVKTRCFEPFPFPAGEQRDRPRIGGIAEEIDALRKRQKVEHTGLTLTAMYNILEKLRGGMSPEALSAGDRSTFDCGLVLVLKELHDRLDAAVAEAYGWPVDLPEEEILARLVALNRERAAEEARGQVRWLRPDYQIPRFGTAAQKQQRQIEAELVVAAGKARKPSFPAADTAQTATVMAALAAAPGPLAASALAASFRQGRRVEPKVAAVLRALARMGYVAALDGGRTYRLRRAA